MKKLAILINSMNGGGAEHVVSILLEEFVKHYEVYLVVLYPGIAYPIPSAVKLHYLDQASLQTTDYQKVFNLPILSYRYAQFCRRNNIQISLSLLNRANYINILSNWLGTSHRTIISERASTTEVYPTHHLRGKISRWLVKWLYPKANGIITISEGIARDLADIFHINQEKIKTIYNPIDCQPLPHLNMGLDSDNKAFTFIAIGRFYEQKNFALLLKAFAVLSHPTAKLVILGDGPLRHSLEKLVLELNIENKVSMPGFIKDIYTHLQKADCFVLSSDYEGFGNVIIEALAAGKAVIATDCRHGPSEILAEKMSPAITHDTGWEWVKYGLLVSIRNATALAQAMNEMIINTEKRKAYELLGPKRASHFNKKMIAQEYMTVLEGR